MKGAITAIITPFNDNGEIDYESYGNIIEFQIKKGIQGILPCGSTGESATLSHEEHCLLIEKTVDLVKKRVPVIAGTGSNSTREAISLTLFAKKIGVDAVLVITPYYNKPTQEGLYTHFKAIAEKAVDLPIILYNVPGRTGVNMNASTVIRLSKIDNIIGIKEASGNLGQMQDIISNTPDDFILLSGDDNLLLPILAIGGKGVISVVANIIPDKIRNIIDLFNRGDLESSKRLYYEILPLCKAMFYETNPIPVKHAVNLMGLASDRLRLPLTRISDSNLSKLVELMKKMALVI